MSRPVALGGVTAALAVLFMSLGTVIPLTTFVWPMLCMLLLCLVLPRLGNRLAWAWYTAVALLSILLAPDKEAVAMFVFLGWYPIVKLPLEKCRLRIVIKFLLFNVAVFSMYWLLISLFGMEYLKAELLGEGLWVTAIILLMGNVTFFLLDRILSFLLKATGGRK